MELDAYREIQCDRIGHDARQPLTKAEAEKILISYRKSVLWHELSPQQKKSLNWRSILGAILHKRAGWRPAALSIVQYGLPSVQQLRAVHDVQEHIQSLAELASAIACWIKIFACDMAEVQQSSEQVLQPFTQPMHCETDATEDQIEDSRRVMQLLQSGDHFALATDCYIASEQ